MKVRFITATALFDHDATAVHTIRKALLKQGAEVIHLGLSRAAHDIVKTVLEEDAHAVVLTSPLPAYRDFYVCVLEQFKRNGLADVKLYNMTSVLTLEKGGKHAEELQLHVDPLPQSGDDNMVAQMIEHSQQSTIAAFFGKNNEITVPKRDHRLALAKYVSLLTCAYDELGENPQLPRARAQLQERLQEHTERKVPVIGITGGGGAGKSCLIDEIVQRIHADFPSAYIAVVAMDPRKRKGGGAVLEDRIRMNNIYGEHVFMRSLATPHLNCLYDVLPDIGNLFKIAGYDFVLMETPGIGQSESDIADIVDIAVYIMTGDYATYSQLEKINMLDFASIIAVNKFAYKGCEDALNQIRQYFRSSHNISGDVADETLPIFGTLANKFNDPGVNLLYLHLLKLLRYKFGVVYTSRYEGKVKAEDAFSSHRADTIIPYDRLNYLGEVVKTVRDRPCQTDAESSQAQTKTSLCLSLASPTPQCTKQQLQWLEEHVRCRNLLLYFDPLTIYGFDAQQQADVYHKLGHGGLNIATWEDFKTVFSGFDLFAPATNIFLNCQELSPVLLAMFLHAAMDQQRERYCQNNNLPDDALIPPEIFSKIRAQTFAQLQGALLWNLPGEMVVENDGMFSFDFNWRLLGDILQYWQQYHINRFSPSGISGYWLAEAGVSAVTQIAFTLANGFTLLEYCRKCGISLAEVGGYLPFFFGVVPGETAYSVLGSVARRVWAEALLSRYGLSKAWQDFQYGVMPVAVADGGSGFSLERDNTLASLYGDAAFLCYPLGKILSSDESNQEAESLVRLQQHLSDASQTSPSAAVNDLATQLATDVLQHLEEMDRRGGVIRAMEYHYQRYIIQNEACKRGRASGVETGLEQSVSAQERQQRIEETEKFIRKNEITAPEALKKLRLAIEQGDNIFAELMSTVKYCTLGQITQLFREMGAAYRRGV
jgi:putative protein kinase ArgK-like GTPase of G3E family